MTDEGACKVGTAVAIGCAGPAAAGADWIAGDSDRDEASEVAADESRITTGGEADDTGVGSRVGGGPVRFGALRTILSEPVLVLGDSLVGVDLVVLPLRVPYEDPCSGCGSGESW